MWFIFYHSSYYNLIRKRRSTPKQNCGSFSITILITISLEKLSKNQRSTTRFLKTMFLGRSSKNLWFYWFYWFFHWFLNVFWMSSLVCFGFWCLPDEHHSKLFWLRAKKRKTKQTKQTKANITKTLKTKWKKQKYPQNQRFRKLLAENYVFENLVVEDWFY